MNEALLLTLAGAAGLGLGAFFFGGLWWTVRQGLASPRPALWFLGSLVVRLGTAVVGFYVVGGGQWQLLVACLAGFIVARFLAGRLTRSAAAGPVRNPPEASHAP